MGKNEGTSRMWRNEFGHLVRDVEMDKLAQERKHLLELGFGAMVLPNTGWRPKAIVQKALEKLERCRWCEHPLERRPRGLLVFKTCPRCDEPEVANG